MFNSLPEDCIAHIFSYTSPRDACRSCLISPMLRRAAETDSVWEKFLPQDYKQILARLDDEVTFSSKKELFFKLCRPLHIDKGKKVLYLNKSTGKKCFIMSARELHITWLNNRLYWSWNCLPESRFNEVVQLRTICWLEIEGKINARMLSQNTSYAAYLILKFADYAYGLDSIPSELLVEIGNYQSHGAAYLGRHEYKKRSLESIWFRNRMETLRSRVSKAAKMQVPCERGDGWLEIQLGEFYNGDGRDDKVVKMSLREVKGEHLKGGLIIEGIEIRTQ